MPRRACLGLHRLTRVPDEHREKKLMALVHERTQELSQEVSDRSRANVNTAGAGSR